MLLYTCQACVRGEHDYCAGKNPPPPGMFGGSECDCDGNCGARAKPDPQIEAIAKALTQQEPPPPDGEAGEGEDWPDSIEIHRTRSGAYVLPEDRRLVEPLNTRRYVRDDRGR